MYPNNQKKEQLPRLDIMLDMETCGIAENAAILDVCMVPFTVIGDEVGIKPFYRAVDLSSCFFAGLSFERDTQMWWMEQDPKARAEILRSEKHSVKDVITESFDWLTGLCSRYDVYIWCRGLNFDIPKYEYLVRLFVEQPVPYKYWRLWDARTYCHTFGVHSTDFPFEGVRHCSMDDCKHQIKQVQAAFKVYKQLCADNDQKVIL